MILQLGRVIKSNKIIIKKICYFKTTECRTMKFSLKCTKSLGNLSIVKTLLPHNAPGCTLPRIPREVYLI